MKFFRFLAITPLLLSSSLVTQVSHAHSLLCQPYGYGYRLELTNPFPNGGEYRVRCSNGYYNDHFTAYVQPYGYQALSGNLRGQIRCDIYGTGVVTVANNCW